MKQKRLTDQEKIDLVSRYLSGEKTIVLARYYKIDKTAVLGILKRRNIPIRKSSQEWRKFNFNENFFEKIDSEAKAYFLGLMFSDGWIAKNHVAGLSLGEEDKYILEKFKSSIGLDKPISLIRRKIKNPKWTDSYCLTICSKKMCSDLSNLGCVVNKSLCLVPPNPNQVPYELVNHFIRGYFDGDGCIHFDLSKKNSAILNICGTKEFLDFIISHLSSKGIKSNFLKRYNTNNNFTLQIGGNRQILVFLDWIYSNSSFCLVRKLEKFNELKRFMIKNSYKAKGGFSNISNEQVQFLLNK